MAIRSRTNKRKNQERQYQRDAKSFLDTYPWCEWFLRQSPRQFVRATSVHHHRGRRGDLLLDKRFWLPTSLFGHDNIHLRPEEARRLGLLCRKGHWNAPVPLDGAVKKGIVIDYPQLSKENLKYGKNS